VNFILRNSVSWLAIFFVIALVLITLFADILFPFIFGMILAYLLDPIVDRLEILGLNRFFSSITVMLLAFGIILFAGILVIPNLLEQAQSLIILAPDLLSAVFMNLEQFLPQTIDKEVLMKDSIAALKESAQKHGGGVASQLTSYAFALIDIIILFLIVPIITFYLLMDWDKIKIRISKYIPDEHAKEINEIVSEIDNTLSGFIRGQLLVCFILGFFYSITLLFVGLNYCFIVGFLAGLLSFIPFLGAFLGASVALSIALFQFWGLPDQIFLVIFIFIIGQILEGNILTPKLIGNAVKLHPVFLMIAVSIGGAIAGLSGVLLSVPVAAILGILIRYFLTQYLTTTFFSGDRQND